MPLDEKDLETLKRLFKEEGLDLSDEEIIEEAICLLNLTASLLGINYTGDDK